MIRIQNIYYMLSYAFKALRGQGYKELGAEEFENTEELCAAILCRGVGLQLKRGLHREYIPRTEPMSAVRGKIDLTESLKTQSVQRHQLVCSYDEFSAGCMLNRILRSTMELLLHADISRKQKKELKNLLVYFRDAEPVDLRRMDWNIRFDKNNETYRMLIGICCLAAKGLLQTQADGTLKLMDFLDEQSMSRLYEKFILEYYRRHYPDLCAEASRIPWALSGGGGDFLPAMQTDVTLQRGGTVLIIDAKYYDQATQVHFDRHTVHSANLYQIFAYVKNRDYSFGDSPHTVSGMLLYAKTDEAVQPDAAYQMSGNRISVGTLDLNQDFLKIAGQLDAIAQEHFKGIEKKSN